MVKIVWTDFAIRDLDDIGEFIARDSERYAKMVVQLLFESTDLLESYPKAGRIIPEFFRYFEEAAWQLKKDSRIYHSTFFSPYPTFSQT